MIYTSASPHPTRYSPSMIPEHTKKGESFCQSPSYDLTNEQLSSGNVTPFAERIKLAREQRRRTKKKTDHSDIRLEIKKVTQSQSRILQQIEDVRRSRLESRSSESDSASYSALPLLSVSNDKRRISRNSFLPKIEGSRKMTKIPSCSRVRSDQTTIIQNKLKTVPSKIPKAQALKSLNCMQKIKRRMRRNIVSYYNSRPSEIIEQARKIEKMSRNKEFALKSVPPLTSKALQMENRINDSLIGSIKAKLSVLVNEPV